MTNKKSRKSSRKSMYGGSDPFTININDKDITLNPSSFNLTPTHYGSYMPDGELPPGRREASELLMNYNIHLLEENVTILKNAGIDHNQISEYLEDMAQSSNYFNDFYKEYLRRNPNVIGNLAKFSVEQDQLRLEQGYSYLIVQPYFDRRGEHNFPPKFCEYYFMLKLWHRMKSDYKKGKEKKNSYTTPGYNELRQIREYGEEYHGGKWSMKYKKSINCKRPKGFSQKQHCKYGRKTRKNKVKKV